MPNEKQLSIRLPGALLARLERLFKKLQANSDLAAFRVSRQSILRLAIMKGMDVLEKEHAEKKPRA